MSFVNGEDIMYIYLSCFIYWWYVFFYKY